MVRSDDFLSVGFCCDLKQTYLFKKSENFRTAILEPLRSHFAKIAHKLAKLKYFSKKNKIKSEFPEDPL